MNKRGGILKNLQTKTFSSLGFIEHLSQQCMMDQNYDFSTALSDCKILCEELNETYQEYAIMPEHLFMQTQVPDKLSARPNKEILDEENIAEELQQDLIKKHNESIQACLQIIRNN